MEEKLKVDLSHELEELFDIRFNKTRDEKILNREAMETQRDIRQLAYMFSDGVPDLIIPMNDHERIKWDSHAKRLMLIDATSIQNLEACSKITIVRVRPYLSQLVKAAKDFYRND